jgi:hypothetical protein
MVYYLAYYYSNKGKINIGGWKDRVQLAVLMKPGMNRLKKSVTCKILTIQGHISIREREIEK